MQVTAVPNTATPSNATNQRTNLGQKDIFLKILVAQMQNQNPLKPQDGAQMSTQLAQFNMVEQQISTNKLLKQMVSNNGQAAQSMATAAAYLNHQASADTSNITFDGSTPIKLSVNLQNATTQANVSIVDTFGNTIRTLQNGSLPTGKSTFTWDGLQNNGTPATAGNYVIKVSATDSTGAAIPATTSISGLVQAVRNTTNGTRVIVGATPVALATITEIK